jgi:lipoate-protein ligase A
VISSCLVKGLNSLGINASLTPVVKKNNVKAPSACFSSPSHYEITVSGKKLVGSAQRRGEGVFLQHGSILTEFDRERLEKVLPVSGNLDCVTSVSEHILVDTDKLISALVNGFEDALGVSFSEGALSEEETALSARYAEEKYSRDEWNFRRPSLTNTPSPGA